MRYVRSIVLINNPFFEAFISLLVKVFFYVSFVFFVFYLLVCLLFFFFFGSFSVDKSRTSQSQWQDIWKDSRSWYVSISSHQPLTYLSGFISVPTSQPSVTQGHFKVGSPAIVRKNWSSPRSFLSHLWMHHAPKERYCLGVDAPLPLELELTYLWAELFL